MPEIKQDLRTATFIVAANDSVHKNMADYVCDGVSDETEINAAIAALPAGGGRVVLSEGTFVIQSQIIPDKNKVVLSGQGESTIIKVCDIVSPLIAVQADVGQKDVQVASAIGFHANERVMIGTKTLANMHFEYNQIASIAGNTLTMTTNLVNTYAVTEYVWSAFHAIEASGKTGLVFKNFKINGNRANNEIKDASDDTGPSYAFRIQNGIDFNNCDDCRIEGVHVDGVCGWSGIMLYNGSTGNTISNCIVEHTNRSGITASHNSSNNLIQNNIIRSTGTLGGQFTAIHEVIFEDSSDYNVLDGNQILAGDGAAKDGVYSYDTIQCVVSNNYISGFANGINLAGSGAHNGGWVISGNSFLDKAAGGACIYCDYSGVVNVLVENNYFDLNYDYGSCIHSTVGAGGWTVQGNFCRRGYGLVRALTATHSNWLISNNRVVEVQAGTPGPNGYGINGRFANSVISDNWLDGNSKGVDGIWIEAAGDNNQIQNNHIASFTTTGIHLDDGNDTIVSGNRIITCATAIDINAAAVTRCQIQGNNWKGSTNNPSYAAATTPVFTDNIDINGVRWLVDDNEVVLKVSVAHDNQNPAIATIPAGSFVTIEVWVNEAFNAGTTNVLTIGYDADPDSTATFADPAVASTGRKTPTYGVEGGYMGTARAIEVYYTYTGGAPTTGHAVVVLRVTKSPTP